MVQMLGLVVRRYGRIWQGLGCVLRMARVRLAAEAAPRDLRPQSPPVGPLPLRALFVRFSPRTLGSRGCPAWAGASNDEGPKAQD